jgi:hypothetical protein
MMAGEIVANGDGFRMSGQAQAEGKAFSGNITLFPPARQVGKVRAAARELFKKRSAAAADRFRSETASRMFEELGAYGVGEDEQDELVGAFLAEVEREMARMHFERIRMHL